MDKPSIEERLQKVGNLSREFAEGATQVSDFWDWFKSKLRDLQGKMPVAINIADDESTLEFIRYNKEWDIRFRLRPDLPSQSVHSLAVGLKVDLIDYCIPMLDKLIEIHEERINKLNHTLSSNELVQQWKEER